LTDGTLMIGFAKLTSFVDLVC